MNKKTLWWIITLLMLLFVITLFFGLRENADKDNLILLVDNQTEIITRYDEELVIIQERLQEANRTISDKEVELMSKRIALEKQEYEFQELEQKFLSVEGFYTPSFDELKSLVLKSGVSRGVYDLASYNCVEFSNDLIAFLYDNKIFSCAVIIDVNDDSGHVFVAVMTTQGLWYIEPQTGAYFNFLDVGSNYCDVVRWKCDWEIKKVSSCFGVSV